MGGGVSFVGTLGRHISDYGGKVQVTFGGGSPGLLALTNMRALSASGLYLAPGFANRSENVYGYLRTGSLFTDLYVLLDC